MINILFVDDEPNILSGLQRMLRPMRHEWQMLFAGSGIEALSILKEKNIDVIVSDMKMPRMDGAQLLQEVRDSYSHIVRIILSGYSEKEMIMKSVGAAHQYLSKPCDAEVLKTTVKRVCALRNLLTDETLRRLVSQMPSVPSLPTLYGALIDELNKMEPSTRKVGDIVKKDIGMTVKILQIINSAFFGLQRQISDSREAVEFLGLDTISSLTLGLGVISQFESKGNSSLLAEIWTRSMSVGILANKIAFSENRAAANDAFTAGLLYDIGTIVLAVNLPKEFTEAQELVKNENISKIEAEKKIFGATHADVGAYLLGLWGLKKEVVEAVAFYKNPNESERNTFTALTAVHIADVIHQSTNPNNFELNKPGYDMEYLEKLGLLEKIQIWQEKYTENTFNKV
ncbi:MAG TPA: response regulator [Pyrinomonadaceae bacterium]|nr:response regulator [Pyrinomonadaceae bacterium]